jgi:HD-like signal output (HDOD) protein
MKHVLFVDDDPNVLAALKRMLRALREEWEVGFADGGDKALEYMAQTPVDVIVTDMRMPGMNGAQLLEQVVALHPGTVRIALSGQSNQEMLMRVAGLAHQYLSKPCDTETLKSTIRRSLALRDHYDSETINRLVSRMNSLPSLPNNYQEVLQELRAPEPSLKRVAEIITRDAAMTAKVLQLVNSAFFGIPRRITNPLQAVTLLGLQTVNGLILAAGVFSQYDTARIASFSADDLIEHSLQVAALAKQIAISRKADEVLANDTFVAGVLHDVGKLVLAVNFSKQYGETLTAAKECNGELCQLEREAFGADHADVGGYLLGLWGLPSSLIEAVAFHHTPTMAQATGFTPLTAVHVANAFSYLGEAIPSPSSKIDEAYLQSIGVAGELPAWRAIAEKTLRVGAEV